MQRRSSSSTPKSSNGESRYSAGAFTPRNEVFADCSLNTLKHERAITASLESFNQYPTRYLEHVEKRSKREIKWSSPTLSQLWIKERKQGAPWRELAESKQQIEDEVTKKELEKRAISLLAKQTADGLRSMYKVPSDAADLIPLLEEGKQQRDSRSGSDSQSSKLYKAAVKFDIRAVLQCLEAKPRNTAPPRLGITRCPRPESRKVTHT